MTPGIEAAHKLALLGYRFKVQGDNILADYRGPGDPDPAKVQPLLDLLRAHRDEVRELLRCYCPTCGGMCFGTFADGQERCLGCYFQGLKALSPGLELRH